MFQYLLFDLDGTLTDSAPGIIASVYYAMEKMGRSVPVGTDMSAFIGPPLMETFQSICGLSYEEATQAVAFYRERYNVTGLFENEVYPGIPELLENLQAEGKQIILATAKPEVMAVRILEHFGLSQYFALMAGASLDSSRARKEQVIAYVKECIPSINRENTVMIGDRDQDAVGAAMNGLDCIGVLYGYGSREELTQAGAKWLVTDMDELSRFLSNTP